jgi:hypothetical protein
MKPNRRLAASWTVPLLGLVLGACAPKVITVLASQDASVATTADAGGSTADAGAFVCSPPDGSTMSQSFTGTLFDVTNGCLVGTPVALPVCGCFGDVGKDSSTWCFSAPDGTTYFTGGNDLCTVQIPSGWYATQTFGPSPFGTPNAAQSNACSRLVASSTSMATGTYDRPGPPRCGASDAGGEASVQDGATGTPSMAVMLAAPGFTDSGHGWLPLETWTWDGSVWSNLGIAGPPGRIVTSLTSLGGALVLFGGSAKPDYLGDTWLFQKNAWTQVSVQGPSARTGAAMATLGNQVVLFGGASMNSATAQSDTWTWDGATWTQQNVVGPPGRVSAAMAPLDGRLILFGGEDIGGTQGFGDTWTWDGTAWSELAVTGPSARSASVIAPLGDKLFLFGGYNYAGGHGAAPDLDTWAFDGTAWSLVTTTGQSDPPTSVAPVDGGLVALFPGTTSLTTWTFDGSAWTPRNVSGPPSGMLGTFLFSP